MNEKRCVVLSDVLGKSSKKAVLSLERKADETTGSVRLYNFPLPPNGLITLGFNAGGKVIKSGLTQKAENYYTFLLLDDFLDEKFSCALVEFVGGEAKPLLYGSSEGQDVNVYAQIISELSGKLTLKNTQDTLDKHEVDFDKQEKAEIEGEIDSYLSACDNCPYKKYFFESKAQSAMVVGEQKETNAQEDKEEVDEEAEEVEEKSEEESFVERLKPQIDKIFSQNSPEPTLEKLIPHSKFVKIEYEDDGDYYVFGIIYENGEAKFVCYGVPAVFEEEPPKELSGYPTFLPLGEQKGFGYWLTYQDAVSGDPIKVLHEKN